MTIVSTELNNLPYKLKSHLSVCPSICALWHADNSVVATSIKTGLTQNESGVFENHRAYF